MLSSNFLSKSDSIEIFFPDFFLYLRVCVEKRKPNIVVRPLRVLSVSSTKLHMLAFSISFILIGETSPTFFIKSGTLVE